jgi:hypothetical protein
MIDLSFTNTSSTRERLTLALLILALHQRDEIDLSFTNTSSARERLTLVLPILARHERD